MALRNIYKAVHAFVDAKPWTKVEQGGAMLFGVEQKDGSVAYAVVTGEENGYTLALMKTAQALAGYAQLLAARKQKADEMELISLQLDQDYLECRLLAPDEKALNRWLGLFGVEAVEWDEGETVLRRHEPAMLPRPLSEEERENLACALYASADYAKGETTKMLKISSMEQLAGGRMLYAKRTGERTFQWKSVDIPKDTAVRYPSLVLEDELAARRLRRLPVSGADVICAVRRLPMPLDEEAERVPTIMLLLDGRQGVVAAPIIGDYEAEFESLAGEYLGYVEENGRPKRILAADPRAYCLLSELATQLSTPIQQSGSTQEINEAMKSLMEYLKNTVEAQEEEDEGDDFFDFAERRAEQPGMGGCLLDGQENSCDEMADYLMEKFSKEDPDCEMEESFLIRAVSKENPGFWLYVSVKKDASLKQLDQFLRDTWVECCGHMSMFRIGEMTYSCNTRMLPGKSMNAKLQNVIEQGVKFDYDYDMGSTTELELEMVGVIKMAARRQKAMLLAENFMPKYKCIRCGRRAELVTRMDMGPIENGAFCMKCGAAAEEEGIEGLLPLLNSPRTGICGYGMWLFDIDDE